MVKYNMIPRPTAKAKRERKGAEGNCRKEPSGKALHQVTSAIKHIPQLEANQQRTYQSPASLLCPVFGGCGLGLDTLVFSWDKPPSHIDERPITASDLVLSSFYRAVMEGRVDSSSN
jgi:hypothetical protein